MSTYSELLNDKEILKQIGTDKEVFITGCPVCANMSLCCKQETEKPLMIKISPKGLKAVCMEKEVKRLSGFVSGKGISAASWVGGFGDIMFCMLDEGALKKFNKKSKNYNTIVLLACDSGYEKLKNTLSGKRIIGAMKAQGLMTGRLKSFLKFIRIYLDKESIKIKRFTFDK